MNKLLLGSLIFALIVAKSIWAAPLATYDCNGSDRIELLLEGKFARFKLYKNAKRPYAVFNALRDVSFSGKKSKDYYRYYHNHVEHMDDHSYFLVERRLGRGERSGDLFLGNRHGDESQFICKKVY